MNEKISIAATNFYSPTATEKAERFISRIRSGVIKKDILPNTSENFTGDIEFSNYVRYIEFLGTRACKLTLSR